MTNLIQWNPLSDSFDDDWILPSLLVNSKRGSFMPAIDMYEDGNEVIIETQLAGIDPEQVDIAIENDTLCIQGKSEKKSEVDDKNYYRKEIRSGSFYRSIPLPMHVRGDEAKASAKDGVLRISIPKVEEVKPKKIKIKTEKK